MGDGARALGELRDDVIHRPGVLPGKAHGWFRTWFAKVWTVRGGGLYAVGWALTFLYLEVTTIVSELAESDGPVDFLTEQLMEFVLRFASDSFVNFIKAFAWPVYLIQLSPLWGGLAIGVAFAVFPITLKKPIERWLFGDEISGSSS